MPFPLLSFILAVVHLRITQELNTPRGKGTKQSKESCGKSYKARIIMSAADNFNGEMAASRKLTDEETADLRSIILKDFKYSTEEKEDVDDLLDYTFAMVSNGKTLSYIVQELVSMEMDVCNETKARGVAMQIANYLQEHVNRVQEPVEGKQESHHVVSLKVCCIQWIPLCTMLAITCSSYHFHSFLQATGEGNALTKSGALGSSRERGKKGETKKDDSKKGDRGNRNPTDNRRDKDSGNLRNSRNRNDRRAGRGRATASEAGGRGRATASEAFERLSGNRNDRQGGRGNDHHRGGRGGDRGSGRGGRGEMWRGGRGDMGRGGPRDMGRGGRASPDPRGGGKGGRGTPLSGSRRSREEMRAEEDFIPAGGRGGRGDGRFGSRGRGRDGGGRGGPRSDYEEGNKRQRIDDSGWGQQGGYYDESWNGYGGYDEGYYDYNWRGGFRGGRGRGSSGRGRGGRSARGFPPGEGIEHENGMEAVANGEGPEGGVGAFQAAAGHPSPIVAASFGGRGYRGRGRGGRGGRSAYRAQVASMLASKSWVRPKKDGEGGGEGGGDQQGGDTAAAASEG